MASSQLASKKRRREPVSVDVKLVEIYEDLANENNEIRLKAAQELVSRFTPDKAPTDEQIQKVLTRLFRGLCSGRKAARVGFSVALTEILSQVFGASASSSSSLSVKDVIELWQTHSHLGGNAAGQEERDYHFGRLFGAEALVKSAILFQDSVPFEEWTNVLNVICQLAGKKPWLREECGWIIFGCIQQIATQKIDIKYAEEALRSICQHGLAKTPEGVAIWIAARDMLPNMSFPDGVWPHGTPLHVREKAALSKIMKESPEQDSEAGKENSKGQKSAVWNPKLHFAWDYVLSRLYTESGEKSKSKDKSSKSTQATFTDFWTEVVDNGLFAAASSEERKFWGFLLFSKVLQEAPLSVAESVFTKNLMRCLMNQLAVEDRYLHRVAIKASKSIQARVENEPQFLVPALKGLMGSSGAVSFDQVTKTKTVEKLVSVASADVVEHILPFFEEMIANPGEEDVKAATSSRQQLAGLLQSIVKSPITGTKPAESEALEPSVEGILHVLARFAYFVPNEDAGKVGFRPKPPITQATQENFRGRITSCLNIIISGRKSPAAIPYGVVSKIHKMDEAGDWGRFVIEMSEPIRESVDSAFKTLKKVTRKEKSAEKAEQSSIQAFKLLYSMTLLQVYNGDADAVSMLDELKFCYSKFLGHKKSDREEGSEASDALVEILLSFASKPSQLFRRMSEQVFGAFAEQVTANGLQSMIAVLKAKDTLSGQQEMFEEQNEDEDEDIEMADADEEESEDDDVEEIDGSTFSDEDDNASDESGAEEGSEDGEMEEFDAKLAEALGTHRADKDLDADESDDAGPDMNDDEMEAIDEQLVNAFRARNQANIKKKDKKDARQTMLNFKNRVLDLLEIYVKKCPSNVLALDLLIPLLQLSRKSKVQQIATRASNVLREYTKLCKGSSLPSLSKSQEKPGWDLLKSIHKEATHSGPASFSTSCSQASLLLVKVLVAHDKATVNGIVDVYAETRKLQLLSSKCHVQPGFFADWNNWCVQSAKVLKE